MAQIASDLPEPSRGPKLSRDERRKRILEVSELYLAGKPQHEIAQKLGCTQQQVSYDLKLMRRYWLQSSIANFDTRKNEELAKINMVERECWESWEKSKQKSVKMVKEKRPIINKEGMLESEEKTTTTIEDTAGDPRWMQLILQCSERRVKLLGLDEPIKHDMRVAMRYLPPVIVPSAPHSFNQLEAHDDDE